MLFTPASKPPFSSSDLEHSQATPNPPTMPLTLSHLLTSTFLLLTLSVSALDFTFNQQNPTGHPLISSSFGVPGTNATFDYVVVGGGTAGLAIATRLVEGTNCSVAVVEAGGFYETDNSNLSVVPGYATYFTGSDPSNFQPLVDWGISTTVQPVGFLVMRY